MHTILAKWLFPAIFVGVSFFLILFLVQVNQNDASIYADKANIPQAKHLPLIPSKEKWIEHFSSHEDEGYFYPVSEIFVEVDLKDPPKTTAYYQLKAGDLDSYQLFCLKEVLKQYAVKYLFEEKNEKMKLFIYSENLNQLKNIVKSLKDYAINANIKRVTR